jgi:hypothetical protein
MHLPFSVAMKEMKLKPLFCDINSANVTNMTLKVIIQVK